MDNTSNKLAIPIALGVMIGFQGLVNMLLFVLALIEAVPHINWVAIAGMPLISCIVIAACFIFAHRGKAHIVFPIIASVFGVSSILMAFVLLIIG